MTLSFLRKIKTQINAIDDKLQQLQAVIALYEPNPILSGLFPSNPASSRDIPAAACSPHRAVADPPC